MRNVIRYNFFAAPSWSTSDFFRYPLAASQNFEVPSPPQKNPFKYKVILVFTPVCSCLNILCVSSVYLKVRILLLFGT